jgi:hypothetical protein
MMKKPPRQRRQKYFLMRLGSSSATVPEIGKLTGSDFDDDVSRCGFPEAERMM